MYPRISDLTIDLFGFRLPFPIYSFGAMVAVAILTAAWLLRREMDRMHAAGQLPAVTTKVPAKEGRRATTQQVSPGALAGTLAFIAAIAGVAGSKLFHIFENLDEFYRNPLGMIFSSGGLTFYGGLIVAGITIAWYVRKKGLTVGRVADAVAPGLMLGYGLGRIGCYLAGDGDWGICSNLANRPGGVPGWLWSETFPRNLLGPDQTPVDVIAYTARQMQESGMDASICSTATGVFPTMLYEMAMCAALFGVLWALRKHRFGAGWLFALYLVFAGAERFLIEKIRVNNAFDFMGMTVTQAEVISVVLILSGLVMGVLLMRKRPEVPR